MENATLMGIIVIILFLFYDCNLLFKWLQIIMQYSVIC